MTKPERMGDTPLVTLCYATLVWPNEWALVKQISILTETYNENELKRKIDRNLEN
jgi:hypothetical protein